ncbi:MAG: protein translocase subunit SecF [Rhodospirillales bacterium]|nr:protein translocase subunit SecF [Rhodospirillales bacterium]MCW8861529.1 protein translocase subunit SecF [Rhodospirillales bacterium]MCW8952898.1 protein translocase subunit SecF [Rhodospirillales bacterium]MCW8971373.1 protein translocase subunit SecF [Rhodospirillales bacterium]MCW9001662.1 protein translocase subunit SecF [Rhodospirillales bacterium]
MNRISLIPAGTNLGFVGKRLIFFGFSLLLVLASVGIFAKNGLNYGIDFKGGILLEVRTQGPADIGAMREKISGLGLGDVSLQEFGEPEEVLINIQRQDGEEKEQQAAVGKVKEALGEGIEYRRTEFVGPKVSEELFLNGVYAVSAAILAILIYIWFRFEWQFGVGAVIALVHDVIATIGVFALTGMEFNLSTVAAVLTIAGYSINDTVVVFDRVRENLRKYKKMDLAELLNMSINETLSRTLMTSFTTLLALFSLYFLGGEVISGFSFAMIWGIVVGTYSSICVAVPILMYLSVRRTSHDNGGEGEGVDEAPEGAA